VSYGIWKFIHILLLVYWLGADLGVFILARAVRSAALTFDQRALLLKYAMIIDFLPRVCFALMLPSGLHLAAESGYADVPVAAFVFAWTLAAAWLWLLFALGRAEGTPRQAELGRINLAGQAVVGAIVIASGGALLAGFGPQVSSWLALKLLLFGLIFPCAIMIDVEFRPIVPAFTRLATEGSTPGVEAIITRTVDRAVWWVLAIYSLVVVITFLGAVKPG
jgi:hypothetical protein